MSPLDVALCVVCVTLVSWGQVLLRMVAARAAGAGYRLDVLFTGATVWAFVIYGGAMIMWLYVLSRVPLTVAFPFFGLCFLMVPLFAHWLIGDPVSVSTWLGGALILAGIGIAGFAR